jgi:hypothetical protein
LTRNKFRCIDATEADAGCRGEALGVEQAEPIPADALDDAQGFEHSEHSAGHLATRPDKTGQVRAVEDRLLGEEEIGMLLEQGRDAPPGVLVSEAVQTAGRLLVRGEGMVQQVCGKTTIEQCERPQLRAPPRGREGGREGERITRCSAPGKRQDLGEARMPDNPDDQLTTIARGALNRDVALEDQDDVLVLALPADDVASPEGPDGRASGKCRLGVRAAPGKDVGDRG